MEDEFWIELEAITKARNITISSFAIEVEKSYTGSNFSSALRVAIMRHYRDLALVALLNAKDAQAAARR